MENVPHEEANEIRDSLERAGIDYIENTAIIPNKFRSTNSPDASAIWVAAEDVAKARQAVREVQLSIKRRTEMRTRADSLKPRGFSFGAALAIIGIVILGYLITQ
jgi:hypothetical protein